MCGRDNMKVLMFVLSEETDLVQKEFLPSNWSTKEQLEFLDTKFRRYLSTAQGYGDEQLKAFEEYDDFMPATEDCLFTNFIKGNSVCAQIVEMEASHAKRYCLLECRDDVFSFIKKLGPVKSRECAVAVLNAYVLMSVNDVCGDIVVSSPAELTTEKMKELGIGECPIKLATITDLHAFECLGEGYSCDYYAVRIPDRYNSNPCSVDEMLMKKDSRVMDTQRLSLF